MNTETPRGKTYKLSVPVTISGITYSELSIRKPKARDFASMPVGGGRIVMGDFFPIIAALCDVEPMVIDALDPEDLPGLMEAVTAFFPKALGGNSPRNGGN